MYLKQTIPTIILVIFSQVGYSQWVTPGSPTPNLWSGTGNVFVENNNVGIRVSSTSPLSYSLEVGSGNAYFAGSLFTQDRIGIGTTSPLSDLDLQGIVKLGDNPGLSPQAGMIRWSGSDFEGYDGGAWNTLGGASTPWVDDLSGLYYDAKEVFIGLDPSTYANTLDYKLLVKGKVLCEEVRVQLRSDWPDYVFLPDYQLMKLEDLANYIEDYHHFPGVPSAGTIAKNGIDSGEMDKVLLEKIEELSLYILQLEQRLKVLENK